MEPGDMIVELVATLAGLAAMAAGVGVSAGEVDVLHMLAQVGAIGAGLTANGAAVRPLTAFRQFLDKSIQLPVGFWKREGKKRNKVHRPKI